MKICTTAYITNIQTRTNTHARALIHTHTHHKTRKSMHTHSKPKTLAAKLPCHSFSSGYFIAGLILSFTTCFLLLTRISYSLSQRCQFGKHSFRPLGLRIRSLRFAGYPDRITHKIMGPDLHVLCHLISD